MLRAFALVMCGIALLAGCGGEGGGERRGGEPRGEAPALEGRLVYERFAGSSAETSKLVLRPDGRAELAIEQLALQPGTDGKYLPEQMGERSVELRPPELEMVQRAVAGVDFDELPAEILPAEPVPDAGGDKLTYLGESVQIGGGADDVPDELNALTATLSTLFNRYAPSRQ